MKPKINFFCIGAQKAGTTTLHNILKQHPDIYLPQIKEAQFFDLNERYSKGIDFYYNQFYTDYQDEKIMGNINPNLSIDNRSIDRIIETYGRNNIKILFILRNPVERAHSHYLMSKMRGYETLTFKEAIIKEKERISNPKIHNEYKTKELGHFEKNHYGYIYRSRYLKTINKIISEFPVYNTKILLFEDFLKDKHSFIGEILNFLELSFPKEIDIDIKSNSAQVIRSTNVQNLMRIAGPVKYIIPTKIRSKLKNQITQINRKEIKHSDYDISINEKRKIYENYFKHEIQKIETVLQKSLDNWKY